MNEHYQLGLLHFVHLLIGADGVADESELTALGKIKINEQLTAKALATFEKSRKNKSERELYDSGIHHLQQCTPTEQLKVFATLYSLSEVDGRVHAREIRLLLYSIKTIGVEFSDVVHYARMNPCIF